MLAQKGTTEHFKDYQEDEIKEKEPFVTEQSDQQGESEQQIPASKNGVFIMRGKGQSIEEFARKCVQSMKDAGLIKEGKDAPSESPTDKRKVVR